MAIAMDPPYLIYLFLANKVILNTSANSYI